MSNVIRINCYKYCHYKKSHYKYCRCILNKHQNIYKIILKFFVKGLVNSNLAFFILKIVHGPLWGDPW